MNQSISEPANVVAVEVLSLIRAVRPSPRDIRGLQQQLLTRHAQLNLRSVVSSEEVVEAFFRCGLGDVLIRRFSLDPAALPDCMNASHKAVRAVCVSPGNHQHSTLPDEHWASAWLQMQSRFPEVNIRAHHQRSARRADLYVVAQRQIVSLEFKYAEARGLRGLDACVSQVRRHAEHHARALLVVYSTSPEMLNETTISANLPGNASVAVVGGPPISVVRG